MHCRRGCGDAVLKYPGRTSTGQPTWRCAKPNALAEQAELAYRNTVRGWHAAQTKKTTVEVGASATTGRASNRPSKGKAARQTTSP
jgi:hypothetical protein